MLQTHDILCCLFLEVSGSLAGLAFKAEDEMPALVVMQQRARDHFSKAVSWLELCWPRLILSDRGRTIERNEIKLTTSHSSELVFPLSV